MVWPLLATPPSAAPAGGISGALAVVLIAAAFAAGSCAFWYLGARRRRAEADRPGDSGHDMRQGPPAPGAFPASPAPNGRDTPERDVLVRACIRARDLTGSGAVREVLDSALSEVGVVAVDPTGERFDPELHCSVGVLSTPAAELDATVARSERVGFLDRGRQIRAAEVVVFTSEAV